MSKPSLLSQTKTYAEDDLFFTCSSVTCNLEFEPSLVDISKNRVSLSDGLAFVKAARFECPMCHSNYTAKVLSVLGNNGVIRDLLFLDTPILKSEGMVVVAS